MNILITSGPTREPIDTVRFITNLSTGKTGAALADYFQGQGHEVTFLHGGDSIKPNKAREILPFEAFLDLNQAMQEILSRGHIDVVFHGAAVGDYSVEQIRLPHETLQGGADFKIDSQEKVELVLKRNFKILNKIKSYSVKKKISVVGFKFTDSREKKDWLVAVRKIYEEGGVDLVVHNDLSERSGEDGPRFRLIEMDEKSLECESRLELARGLENWLRRHL